MRLNVCSGDKHWPGFTNVDQYSDVADINADCRHLKFDYSTADEIHCIHGVEHVPRLDVENMLMDWHRVLKPGGKLVIEVPCLDKIAQSIVNKEKNIRMTTLGIFGDPRDTKPGMMHQWCYTGAELSEILNQCGFIGIEVMEPVFHIPARDMRIEAVKP